MAFESILERYDRFVVFDTETTGLDFQRDEIIEFAAVAVEKSGEMRRMDEFVTLSYGNRVPAFIEQLTGISDAVLSREGIPKAALCEQIASFFAGKTLVAAYNAHFDFSFLYYLLLRQQRTELLRGVEKLDLLTVYRDRRPYPHKLKDAVAAYSLAGRVCNSHRAIDDVLAALAVAEEMEKEKPDLLHYINLFGYSPKFGISGKPIGSVTYRAQGFEPGKPIYEEAAIC